MVTRAEQRTARLQREADKWNAQHPLGTPVRYWRWLKEGEPSGTGPTRHAAVVMGDHVSVWIDGCIGSVNISHVEAAVISPTDLAAAVAKASRKMQDRCIAACHEVADTYEEGGDSRLTAEECAVAIDALPLTAALTLTDEGDAS